MNNKNQGTPSASRNKLLDLFAGLSVASILLPEAVAYSSIAHLSIQSAISAMLIGLICYACIGASRFAIVSPTSSSAALIAAAALSLTGNDLAQQSALSFGLVMLTGAGLILVAFIRLGRLSAFVSRPVLHGFSFALAFTIIVKQLPKILGINATGSNPFTLLAHLFKFMPDWSWWSLASGVFALLLLICLRRFTLLPAAFIVLASGIAISYVTDLSAFHITTVGHFALEFPLFSIPDLTMKQWLDSAELAGGLLVIVFSESWGSIRSLAIMHGDRVDSNREIFALGAANLASGVMQGMPVGAGFSASVANESAGAISKWSGIFAACSVFILAVFSKNLIEHIPEPVLAATVVGALLHALNPQPIIELWRINRDQYLTLAAIVSVLFFGVLHGMLIAVALSLAAAIRTFSQPAVRELTELDSTRNYVDRENHPEAKPHPHILILRPEEPLFFASVDGVFDVIRSILDQRSDCKILILSLEQSNDLDSSARDGLIELCNHLKEKHMVTLLARVKDPVRNLLQKSTDDLFRNTMFWSVADAAQFAEKLLSEKLGNKISEKEKPSQ